MQNGRGDLTEHRRNDGGMTWRASKYVATAVLLRRQSEGVCRIEANMRDNFAVGVKQA